MNSYVLRKLHFSPLPLAALFAAANFVPAEAEVMHADASLLTYTDFAQNTGRFQAGATNALLAHIRAQEGGVVIAYVGGRASYVLPHGMIDFGGLSDQGANNAIGYNFIATVAHNGVIDQTYSGAAVGAENAVRYSSIEYRNGYNWSNSVVATNSTFSLSPETPDGGVYDYKIARQSKIFTDVVGSQVFSGTLAAGTNIQYYRAGSGTMKVADHSGATTEIAGAYQYAAGSINTGAYGNLDANGNFNVFHYANWTPEGVNAENPLPYSLAPGDSGSPAWIWNEATGQFEYLAAGQSGTDEFSHLRGNTRYTLETMASFDKEIALSADASKTIYVNAVTGTVAAIADAETSSTLSTTDKLATGTVTFGDESVEFKGVRSGTRTWKDLSAEKDKDNWFNYGDEYLNVVDLDSRESLTATTAEGLRTSDLFMTENLVFTAAGTEQYRIVLKDTADTGVGYVQFSKADGVASASFRVSSEAGESNLLDTAGFIVDTGVSVELDLTSPTNDMREWRKAGAGDLTIVGSGNNDALLNVGGAGKLVLSRENGYAAYNVLASTGATVVIKDVNQVARDVTLGNGGATLDFNGNSMMWDNAAAVSAEGFTIHALTEGAVLTNSAAGTTTTLIVKNGGESFVGSFADTAAGALKLVYAPDSAEAVWTLTGVFTNLTNNAESGIVVQNGTLKLAGTNTVHALGSATGTNADRYFSADDWHYADAAANVAVESGATFELGSHARLTGDVTVRDGGVFTMNSGVNRCFEYVEGGYALEDTEKYSAFFGLKGNVALDGANAKLLVRHESADATADMRYDGNVTGTGQMRVALNSESSVLTLGGANTFSGAKTLETGTLVANAAALGDTSSNKWNVGARGVLRVADDSSLSSAELLSKIDGASTGVLALVADRADKLDVSAHAELYVGAAAGTTVNYGAENTSETLEATDGHWRLGGGGGELRVNFKLTGAGTLALGNAYGKGTVVLTNAANDFTGAIQINGGVSLFAENAGALGSSSVALDYGTRFGAPADALDAISEASAGTLLADKASDAHFDFSSHANLALGAAADTTFTGTLTVAENAAYRFGGSSGTLALANALNANGVNALVVDGQGFSGGALRLDAVSGITGAVSVVGRDATKTSETAGDATLSFSVNDALAQAASVAAKDGGVVDLAGTTQTFRDFALGDGGTLADSSEGGTGTLRFSSSAGTLGGVVAARAVKTDAGTLTFTGTVVEGGRLEAAAGTLAFTAAAAAGGELAVSGTGALAYSDSLSNAVNLVMDGGTMTISGETTFGANLTMNAGKVTVETTDSLDYGATNTLTLAGGELALGANRWSVGSGNKITLAGGTVTGTGQIENGANIGSLDFFKDTVLSVVARADASAENPTVSRIAAPLRLRAGTTTFDVGANARLEFSSAIVSQSNTFQLKIADGGSAELTLASGSLTLAGESKISGDLTLSGAGTFAAGSIDALDYGATNTLTFASAAFDFGTNRWSVGSGNEIVFAGGTVSGAGQTNADGRLGALDFFSSTASVVAAAGTRTEVSATLRLRTADTNVIFDAKAGSDLVISGDVIGDGKLEKKGDGALTLSSGTNTFAGGVKISGGKLSVASVAALGSGATTVESAGTLALAGANDTGASATTDLSTKVSGAGRIEFSAAGTNADASKYSNLKLGEDFTGTLAVTSGMLYAENKNTQTSFGAAKTIELDGGGLFLKNGNNNGLNGTDSFSQDFVVGANGGSLVLYAAHAGATFTGSVTGTGTLSHLDGGVLILAPGEGKTIALGGLTQNTNYSGYPKCRTEIRGDATIGTLSLTSGNTDDGSVRILSGNVAVGTANINKGKLKIEGGTAGFGEIVLGTADGAAAELSLSGGRLNVGAGGIRGLGAGAKTVTFANATVGASADWYSALDVALSGAVAFDTAAVGVETRAAAGATIRLGGGLSGEGSLTKLGAGTLELSGDNSGRTGETTISAGTLVAAHAKALGSGKVTVAGGAELGLVAGTTVVGVSGGIEFAEGAKLVIDLSGLAAVPATLAADGPEETRALTLVSESALSYNGAELADGEVSLIGYELKNAGDFAAWTSQLRYDASANALTLTLTVPEPGAFSLFAGTLALAFCAARRRRRR
ncbi:S6 family peptidase [Candidatus Spyradosoma sp. SGI.093]|uniref:S6 family peptidase n=1 Tax=Candidatus Spyradosoma sp. SGI.093 TaxID=3420583 RepID=UPI003D0862D5